MLSHGHEIGIDGYTHENPLAMADVEQETEVLDRTFEVIKSMSGKAPVGYMAPGGNSVLIPSNSCSNAA